MPGSELLAPAIFSAGHNPLVAGNAAGALHRRHDAAAPSQNNKATPSVANHRRDPAVGRGQHQLDLRQLRRGRHHHGQRHRHHLRGGGRRSATSSTSPTTSTTLLAKINAIDAAPAIPSDDLRRRDHAAHRHGLRSLGHQFERRRHSPRSASPARDRGARRRRHGRHRTGDRQRQFDLPRRVDRRRRGDGLRRLRLAGEPAVPLGQGRQLRRSAPAIPTPGTCSIRSIRMRPAPQVAWQNVNTNFTFSATGQMIAGGRVDHAHQRRRQRRRARQPRHQFRRRRPDAVRRRQRQRPGQPDPAGRFPGRSVAVGRRQRPTAASSATTPTAATSTSPKSRSRPSTAPTSSSASTAARSR